LVDIPPNIIVNASQWNTSVLFPWHADTLEHCNHLLQNCSNARVMPRHNLCKTENLSYRMD